MDFYKKIIKNKKTRIRILSLLKFVPDSLMLRLQYWIKFRRRLNLSSPIRYTEKIQWYKLNYRDPLMSRCADKYQVRSYIEEKGLGNILNELYAVFPSAEALVLDDLPDRFVLKVSNGSGTNLLVENKFDLDIQQVRRTFRDFYVQAGACAGREWVYQNSEPVIIAERYLQDPAQRNGSLRDYKILCFNGEPEYIICVDGRYTDHYCHVVYDIDWNKQDVVIGDSSAAADYERPETLDEMLRIARILSEDFPAVRVDLYSIEGKIYFGELTFFPWSGYMFFKPDEFDLTLGAKFILPERNSRDDR